MPTAIPPNAHTPMATYPSMILPHIVDDFATHHAVRFGFLAISALSFTLAVVQIQALADNSANADVSVLHPLGAEDNCYSHSAPSLMITLYSVLHSTATRPPYSSWVSSASLRTALKFSTAISTSSGKSLYVIIFPQQLPP